MTNYEYVANLLSDRQPDWAIEQLAADLDKRDSVIGQLETEIRGLKKSLEVVSASEDYWRAFAKGRIESPQTKRPGPEDADG